MTGEHLDNAQASRFTKVDSPALRDEGLQIAYQYNKTLKNYVDGVEQERRGGEEVAAAVATLAASILNGVEGNSKLAWLFGASSAISGTKGFLDVLHGTNKVADARPNLNEKSYQKLLQSGDGIDRCGRLIKYSMETSAVAGLGILGARFLHVKLPRLLTPTLSGISIGLSSGGFIAQLVDGNQWNDALYDVARGAEDTQWSAIHHRSTGERPPGQSSAAEPPQEIQPPQSSPPKKPPEAEVQTGEYAKKETAAVHTNLWAADNFAAVPGMNPLLRAAVRDYAPVPPVLNGRKPRI